MIGHGTGQVTQGARYGGTVRCMVTRGRDGLYAGQSERCGERAVVLVPDGARRGTRPLPGRPLCPTFWAQHGPRTRARARSLVAHVPRDGHGALPGCPLDPALGRAQTGQYVARPDHGAAGRESRQERPRGRVLGGHPWSRPAAVSCEARRARGRGGGTWTAAAREPARPTVQVVDAEVRYRLYGVARVGVTAVPNAAAHATALGASQRGWTGEGRPVERRRGRGTPCHRVMSFIGHRRRRHCRRGCCRRRRDTQVSAAGPRRTGAAGDIGVGRRAWPMVGTTHDDACGPKSSANDAPASAIQYRADALVCPRHFSPLPSWRICVQRVTHSSLAIAGS